MKSKVCSRCRVPKVLDSFHRHKGRPGGRREVCKDCRKLEGVENKDTVSEKRRVYYAKNRERLVEYSRNYRVKHPGRAAECSKAYYRRNKSRVHARIRERYRSDSLFRLSRILRVRFHEAVTNNYKKSKWREVLGCSIPELRGFLEDKFREGMSWENHGEWHIDHIVPLSSFDLTSEDGIRKAFHHTNLQPLWASENLSKGDNLQ